MYHAAVLRDCFSISDHVEDFVCLSVHCIVRIVLYNAFFWIVLFVESSHNSSNIMTLPYGSSFFKSDSTLLQR